MDPKGGWAIGRISKLGLFHLYHPYGFSPRQMRSRTFTRQDDVCGSAYSLLTQPDFVADSA
jgi:hypothetical protein